MYWSARLFTIAIVVGTLLTAGPMPGGLLEDVEIRANTEKRHRLDEYAYREDLRDDGTHVLGTIHEVVVWKANKSPYVMEENVIVANDGVLIIEPGVEVKAVRLTEHTSSINAYVCLWIRGTLTAEGRPDSMIRFTSASDKPERYREWQGVVFSMVYSGSTFKWVLVEHAIFGVDAYGSPLIAHCIFRKCHTGIYLERGFTGNVLHNVSAYNAYSGIRCRGTPAEATIVNNICYENGDGIRGWLDAVAYADYNLYWSSKPNASARYYSGMEPGAHDVKINPRFVDPQRDDFRLADDSPARGAGFGKRDMGLFIRGWNAEAAEKENAHWSSDGARKLWCEGLALEGRGRPSAEEKYRLALEKDVTPEFRDKITCSLARVLISKYSQAKQILQMVLSDSEFPHIRDLARQHLANAWAIEGKPDEALSVAQAIEWPQSKVWAKPAIAKYKSMTGNYEDALRSLASLREKEPYRYLKTLSEMVSSHLSAGQVDAAVVIMKGFEAYPFAPEAATAYLGVAKAAHRQQRFELAVELLEESCERDPFSKEAPESLLLLADILDQDMNRHEEGNTVLAQLCTNYFPFNPYVMKANKRIHIENAPPSMMILLDASLREPSIFDRGPSGGRQYGVIRILTEAGYIVHTNDRLRCAQGDLRRLTHDLIRLYGLIIFNGGSGGPADSPIPPDVIETLVEYVDAGGSLLVVAAGRSVGSGKQAQYYNALVQPFGLGFVENVDLPTKLGTATDHPAVNGLRRLDHDHGAPVTVDKGDVLAYVEEQPMIALARYGRGKVIAAGLGQALMGGDLGTGGEQARMNKELLVRLVSYLLSPEK